MSPEPFRSDVAALLAHLTRSWELCTAVRTNRRLGSKHEALDSLQDNLQSSISSIQIEFDTLRQLLGSRMDLGDERSCFEIKQSIRNVANDIRPRLEDIAFKRDSSDGHSSHSSSHGSHGPGFRDLLRKWNRVEADVEDTLQSLSRRLEKPSPVPEPPRPKPVEKPSYSRKDKDVAISLRELDRYMAHMKKSWEEQFIAGQIVYVNCFDPKKMQWERPEGAFIKSLKRKGSWERTSPTMREDSWGNTQGW